MHSFWEEENRLPGGRVPEANGTCQSQSFQSKMTIVVRGSAYLQIFRMRNFPFPTQKRWFWICQVRKGEPIFSCAAFSTRCQVVATALGLNDIPPWLSLTACVRQNHGGKKVSLLLLGKDLLPIGDSPEVFQRFHSPRHLPLGFHVSPD